MWLLVTLLAGAGLRFYHVDNTIDAWAPDDLRSGGQYKSYAVVGWPTDKFTDGEVEQSVRATSGVAQVLDRSAVVLLQPLTGAPPSNFVRSPAGDYAGLFCFPDKGVSDDVLSQRLRRTLAERFGGRAGDIALGGPAFFHEAINDFSQRRMPLVVGGMMLLGLSFLRWIAGTWRFALTAVTAVSMSQVILLGGIAWLGRPIDLAASMAPPLMMALGYSYNVHRCVRRETGPALMICGAAAVVGIGSFVFNPLLPVRQFAAYGAIGIVLAWLAAITLVQPPQRRRPAGQFIPALLRVVLVIRRKRTAIWAVAVVVMAVGTLAAPQVRIGNDPLRFFPADAKVKRDFQTLDARLTGMLPFQLVLSRPVTQASLGLHSAGVRAAVDVSFTGGAGQTLWCLADNDAISRVVAAVPTWTARAAEQGATLRFTGVAAQLDAAQQALISNAIGSLASMVIAAALMIAIVTRRVSAVLQGMTVSLLPVAVMFLFSVLVGVPLELPSLMIGAVSLGLSIDDTLHLGHAAIERGNMTRGVIECWLASVGSSLLTCGSLAMFAFSAFSPTRQFGLWLALSTLVAITSNLLLINVCSRRSTEPKSPDLARSIAGQSAH